MEILTTTALLSFIQANGYFMMFFIMIFEGTIVSCIAAFLASTGLFNIYIIIALAILGNFVGDTIFFFLGKYLGKKYLLNKLKSSKWNKLKQILIHVNEHPGKVITIVKNTPLIPIPGLMLIGASGLKTKKFYIYSAPTSVIRALLFVLMGYFSGAAFNALVGNLKKTNLIICVAVLLGIGIWILVNFILKRMGKQMEKLEEKLEKL